MPSAPFEIGVSLDELSSALANLDHSAVDIYCSRLSALAPRLKTLVLPELEVSKLSVKLHLARTLVENARELYEGWAKLAISSGAAYTTTGDEYAPGLASSVAVQA